MGAARRHSVSIVCNGMEIRGWEDYEISSSIIEPADTFRMSRPWSSAAWDALPRDSRIRVLVDGTPVLTGFLDDRIKRAKDGVLEISGRDRAGRLVQGSAPSISYAGLDLVEAIRRLVAPEFTVVTLSDARNRKLRLGKGRKVSAGNEPIVLRVSSKGGGRVQPGQFKWDAIQEIASRAGLIVWSSADGREIFVGRPASGMAPQFTIRHCLPGSKTTSTCLDLTYTESNGDRYSMIATVGTGGGTAADSGNYITQRSGVVFDNEANTVNGTGRDFIEPKLLMMPERDYLSIEEASSVAGMEQLRRDFRRTTLSASMPFHGQWVGPAAPTIFAPNTIAAVYDEDFTPALDADFLIYAVTFSSSRTNGETTMLELVPEGTQIVL